MPKPVRLLLVAALMARLLVWALALPEPARFLEPDSADYLRLAHGLLDSGVFGSAAAPEIFRTPGYPFSLALGMSLKACPAFICLLQVLLDALACLLVWRLAERLFQERAAALAGLAFQALSVVSIVYCNRVLSESIFTLALLAFLLLYLELIRGGGEKPGWGGGIWRKTAAAGLALAVLAYLRAVALPYACLAAVWLLLRRRWRQALLLAAVAAALLLPWVARNQARTGLTTFSSVGAVNLYRYNACLLLARQHGRGFAEQQALIDAELAALPDQAAVARHCMARGREAIAATPLRYAALHARASLAALLPAAGELLRSCGAEIGGSGTLAVINSKGIAAGVRHYFHGRPALLAAALPAVLLLFAAYAGAGAGLWARRRAGSLDAADLWLWLTIGYFLLVAGPAAHPRFRVPVAPLISAYAGVGAVYLWSCIRNLRRKA